MYDKGCLAELSLDGFLAVDIETDALTVGETVTVTTSDGKQWDGTVDAVSGGKATVLISDDGPLVGDTATVGALAGEVYIHSPLEGYRLRRNRLHRFRQGERPGHCLLHPVHPARHRRFRQIQPAAPAAGGLRKALPKACEAL